MHDEIRTGKRPPRFFVSVSVEAGLADRITGMVTQMFVAVLGERAFTVITYGGLPYIEGACESHYINWTHPTHLADAIITPLKTNYRGSRRYDSGDVNNNTYAPFSPSTMSTWSLGKAETCLLYRTDDSRFRT